MKKKKLKAALEDALSRLESLDEAINSVDKELERERKRNDQLQENVMDMRLKLCPCPEGFLQALDGSCIEGRHTEEEENPFKFRPGVWTDPHVIGAFPLTKEEEELAAKFHENAKEELEGHLRIPYKP